MKYQIFIQFNLLFFILIIVKIDNWCDVDSPLLTKMFDYSDITLCDVPFVLCMHLCTYALYHLENSKLINVTFENNSVSKI